MTDKRRRIVETKAGAFLYPADHYAYECPDSERLVVTRPDGYNEYDRVVDVFEPHFWDTTYVGVPELGGGF